MKLRELLRRSFYFAGAIGNDLRLRVDNNFWFC